MNQVQPTQRAFHRTVHPTSVRQAFTLVEMLVVVAIIGILMGMLFPAAQAVRESARRTTCLNNLRQLGIAFQNYESAIMKIPPSRGSDEFLTWPVFLMPYLEKNNLADRLDSELLYQLQDPEAVAQPILEMLCPTRSYRSSYLSQSETKGGPVGACGDYAGNAGSSQYFPWDLWALFHEPVDGVINSGYAVDNPVQGYRLPGGGKGRYGFPDVTDGLSNTFFVGEKYVSIHGAQKPGGWGDGCTYNGDEPETVMRVGGLGMGIAANEDLVLSPGEYPVFGSSHPQICNFLLGDSSVRPISKLLNVETLHKLCSREDGTAVTLDEQ
jgi:prepilin-type N-terminal cleavage/methylation domain-containing protein